MVFIFLYLVQLLIRPQDFSPHLMGLPTAWLIVLPGLIFGIMRNSPLLTVNRIPQCVFLLALVGVVFVSTLLNVGMDEAILQFEVFIKRVMAFFMIYLIVDTKEKLKSTLLIYIILAATLGLHAIMQLKTGYGFNGLPPLTFYDPPRAVWYGAWDGSNSFGVIFLTALPICLEFVVGRYSLTMRAVGIISLPFVCAGLYYIDSRGDTLSALLALGCFSIMKFSKKTNLILFITAIILLGALLPSRMSQINTSEESAHERTWVWEQGIALLRENPLFGVGSDQFVKNTSSGLIAHSNYVSTFSELGLLGFFIFLSLCWLSLKVLLKIFFSGQLAGRIKNRIILLVGGMEEEDETLRGLALALLSSFCGFYAATFFIVLLNDLLFFFWALSACLWTIASHGDNDNRINFKFADAILVLSGMFTLITIIWYIAAVA